ncbi:MAG: hypothetical protein R6V77_00765 [Candidatus Cloacimonadaceae bacterium]
MRKIIVITMVMLMLGFVLYAQNMRQNQMKDDCDDCGDCKEQPMMKSKGVNNPQSGHRNMNWDKNMMKELNLNEAQIKKLETLRADHAKQLNTNKARLQNLQIDKNKAMKAEEFAKVKQFNKNIADLELEMSNLKVDHHQALMKELTAEQKAKFEEMRRVGMKGMQDGKMHNNMEMMREHKGK